MEQVAGTLEHLAVGQRQIIFRHVFALAARIAGVEDQVIFGGGGDAGDYAFNGFILVRGLQPQGADGLDLPGQLLLVGVPGGLIIALVSVDNGRIVGYGGLQQLGLGDQAGVVIQGELLDAGQAAHLGIGCGTHFTADAQCRKQRHGQCAGLPAFVEFFRHHTTPLLLVEPINAQS
ncbi:hypothetical protein FQZ97_792730 [compost metagenome]